MPFSLCPLRASVNPSGPHTGEALLPFRPRLVGVGARIVVCPAHEEQGRIGLIEMVTRRSHRIGLTDLRLRAAEKGPVKGIKEFGAFVEFLPGKDGLLHISEISWDRIDTMDGVFKEGDKVKVKLVEVDKKTGKFRLSAKALLPKPESSDKSE